MNFKSINSLKPLENVINESSQALIDKERLIVNSSIPEAQGAALGFTSGGIGSFTALYTSGTVGLSAVGIISGVVAIAAGVSFIIAVVVYPMVAAIIVLAANVAIFAVVGYVTFSYFKRKKLKQEKERLYQEALRKHDAIQNELKKEFNASKDRVDYLNSLVILLSLAIKDLEEDMVSA